MPRPVRPAPRDGGFTLIEVLVAMLILATAVTAVLQLFGGGLRLARASGDYTGAAVLASAKLAEVPPGALEEGTIDGEQAPYRWTRRVAFEPGLLPIDPGGPEGTRLRLARVSVEVSWSRGQRLELGTLRAWRASP
jgi:general secretion pathway protein I